MKAVFITATDTDVGKTIVTGLLAKYLLDKGCNVITQKWIQTGSSDFPDDVAAHLKLMHLQKKDIEKHLPDIAPYTFALPASPHLAAEAENKIIEESKIKTSFKNLTNKFDTVIVEGVGGALVPFNRKKLVIDIAAELDLPVIIVAKNKLGAINHTLLTIEAIEKRNIKIAGLIFNTCPNENPIITNDNPKIIKTLTNQKILGTLPWSKNMDSLSKNFIPIGDKLMDYSKEKDELKEIKE